MTGLAHATATPAATSRPTIAHRRAFGLALLLILSSCGRIGYRGALTDAGGSGATTADGPGTGTAVDRAATESDNAAPVDAPLGATAGLDAAPPAERSDLAGAIDTLALDALATDAPVDAQLPDTRASAGSQDSGAIDTSRDAAPDAPAQAPPDAPADVPVPDPADAPVDGSEPDLPADAPDDTAEDTAADAAGDAPDDLTTPPPDALDDAAEDTAADAPDDLPAPAPDAPDDVPPTPDLPPPQIDLAEDAPPDAEPDLAPDVLPDAPADQASDAPVDAAIDAPIDTAPDLAPDLSPDVGPSCATQFVWETDFSVDPTTLNDNGDGVKDWNIRGGGAFPVTQLMGGVWTDAGGVLDINPTNLFASRTLLHARVQQTAIAGNGAYVWINIDNVSIGRFAAIFVTVTKEAVGQKVELWHKPTNLPVSLGAWTGLPDKLLDIKLDVDPATKQVSIWIEDVFRATFAYSTQASGVLLDHKWASLWPSSANCNFDYFKVSLCQ